MAVYKFEEILKMFLLRASCCFLIGLAAVERRYSIASIVTDLGKLVTYPARCSKKVVKWQTWEVKPQVVVKLVVEKPGVLILLT